MRELERRASHLPNAATIFKRLDGKPLPISAHTTDPDARWGHGAGQMGKGYKLHVIWAGSAMPLCWRVASMDVSEQEMARRMLRELGERGLCGHVSADAGYDVNPLYHAARQAGNTLLAPRRKPGTALGHRAHAADRIRAVELTEGATSRLSGMGRGSRRGRTQVERDFGNLVSFGGGLSGTLPAWARRHGRVRRWVWAKLLINAARIRIREHKCRSGE